MGGDWHLDAGLLDSYGEGRLDGPVLWSVEAHLAACAVCRGRIATASAAPAVERIWQRLDAAVDAPRPGAVEWLLLRIGVPEHLARLLAATPTLRLSWLCAVAVTLTIGVAASWLGRFAQMPLALLAVVPMIAVVGVAVAFGPRVDPTYEIGLAAPFDTFRLVLLRTSAVLTVTIVLAGLAGVAAPGAGLRTMAWLAPALLLTVATLGLSPALGPVRAARITGATWLLALVTTVRLPTGSSALFEPAVQAGMAATATAAAVAVLVNRWRFDTGHRLPLTPRSRRLHR
ncbi:hypothetical protein ACTMSW_09570 [Micromonospora sp. BQ11]|uniref:hypothetical protein n=1 Tax=Micromonospora sp. BQ11 TaxID=3452212 RepID=UPI003F8C2240